MKKLEKEDDLVLIREFGNTNDLYFVIEMILIVVLYKMSVIAFWLFFIGLLIYVSIPDKKDIIKKELRRRNLYNR